jgi:hypothetical protein
MQGVPPKCLNGFIVTEVNHESELARGSNLWNVEPIIFEEKYRQ